MRSVFVCLLLLFPLTGRAENRLFVLQGEEAILEVDIDDEGNARQVRAYRERDLPGVFPAQSLEMRDGNILVTYDGQKRPTARLLYRRSQGLTKYDGNPGQASDLAGRRLEKTDTAQNFRSGSRLYSESGGGHYLDRQHLARLQGATGDRYRDLFVLDDAAFGVAADRIDRLSGDDAGALEAKEALAMPGSRLTAAAVSPWGEVFVSDESQPTIHRLRLQDDALIANGTLAHPGLRVPRGLEFTRDGELLVANAGPGPDGVLRFGFETVDFNWRGRPNGGIDLDGKGATDLVLARTVGYVLSEKQTPLIKLSPERAGGHYGISQVGLVLPGKNSEAAIIALVQYEPGGYTPVHYHPDMEQAEIVVSGRAIWEVGEFEREVGPGDVIFCPRYAKHGYKVLGDEPFKFFQLEWRSLGNRYQPADKTIGSR
ncbi:MAG: cupin domain-containing protein [Acidobacteriota bacterium]|nr:cupin domain-containing protein [Acidobacteriota bacterium]